LDLEKRFSQDPAKILVKLQKYLVIHSYQVFHRILFLLLAKSYSGPGSRRSGSWQEIVKILNRTTRRTVSAIRIL